MLTACQEIKIIVSVEFGYFASMVNISLLSSLFAIFSSFFKIIKQASDHNHERAIYRPVLGNNTMGETRRAFLKAPEDISGPRAIFKLSFYQLEARKPPQRVSSTKNSISKLSK